MDYGSPNHQGQHGLHWYGRFLMVCIEARPKQVKLRITGLIVFFVQNSNTSQVRIPSFHSIKI